MGQIISSRRGNHESKYGNMKRNKVKKSSLEVWKQFKDIEIARLQEKTKETEKECEKIRRQIACQSFLLKEIFEDQLKEQRETHNKEISELKNEISKLKKLNIININE